MHYELQQVGSAWVVSRQGRELGRFDSQQQALDDIAVRLEAGQADAPAALSLRFSTPEAGG